MMNTLYRQPNKRRFSRAWWWLPVIVVVLGLIFTPLGRNLATRAAAPLLRGTNALGRATNNFFAYFQSKTRLETDNTNLRTALARTETKLALFENLKQDNANLRAILGKKPNTESFLLAEVLHRPNQSPYDTLIVDLGSENSNPELAAGLPVTMEGEWIIGEVAAVYGRSAKVTLFSAAGRETPVMLGESGVTVLAQGRGGGNFLVELPRSVTIEEGTTVKTVRGEKLWPLGLVSQIKSNPSDPFQTVTFKNPVNVYELGRVEIVITP